MWRNSYCLRKEHGNLSSNPERGCLRLEIDLASHPARGGGVRCMHDNNYIVASLQFETTYILFVSRKKNKQNKLKQKKLHKKCKNVCDSQTSYQTGCHTGKINRSNQTKKCYQICAGTQLSNLFDIQIERELNNHDRYWTHNLWIKLVYALEQRNNEDIFSASLMHWSGPIISNLV